MEVYPAIQAKMGNWRYYIVKMKMRELAGEVMFANDVYEDKTLGQAIQRTLNEGRVKNSILGFLTKREDRFFSSLVVAAIGGNPKFYPVKITDDPQFQMLIDQDMDDHFGVLTFSGSQGYYALDGQHRLKAIKTLLDHDDPASHDTPQGFQDEEISVLMILPPDATPDEPDNESSESSESSETFLRAYRRLFSSLNRYAKATDNDTNIIMDEDDCFAIVTRRLISEHDFFKWDGKERLSPKIQTKGKNLRTTDTYFTSLQTLYQLNMDLLTTTERKDVGWGDTPPLDLDRNRFLKFRPSEEYLELLYDELAIYWDGILTAMPELKTPPQSMRNHTPPKDDEPNTPDHLLFWPIGQELFGKVARAMLNAWLPEDGGISASSVAKALAPLHMIDWNLHQPPWKHLVLVQNDRGNWIIRNEERKAVMLVAERLVRWMVGLDPLASPDQVDLRLRWEGWLINPNVPQETMWDQVLEQRKKILS